MVKTISKKQQELMDDLDRMIDYSKKAKKRGGGIKRLGLNKQQAEIYLSIVGKKQEFANENEHVPVNGNMYKDVEIYW